MKKGIIVLIVFIVLLLIAASVGASLYFAGYFNKTSQRPRGQGNFQQLTQVQIDEITSYFQSTTDINAISTYCNDTQNRMSCFYYCRNIEPTNAYCTQLGNMTRRNGNYSRDNNYSRGPGGAVPAN